MRHSVVARGGAAQPGGGVGGGRPPEKPTLTAEERDQLSHQVKSLSVILQPARERGPELEVAIGSMFAVMNVFIGDDAKLKLQAGVRLWVSIFCLPSARRRSGP